MTKKRPDLGCYIYESKPVAISVVTKKRVEPKRIEKANLLFIDPGGFGKEFFQGIGRDVPRSQPL